jgi:hypothetical protein
VKERSEGLCGPLWIGEGMPMCLHYMVRSSKGELDAWATNYAFHVSPWCGFPFSEYLRASRPSAEREGESAYQGDIQHAGRCIFGGLFPVMRKWFGIGARKGRMRWRARLGMRAHLGLLAYGLGLRSCLCLLIDAKSSRGWRRDTPGWCGA